MHKQIVISLSLLATAVAVSACGKFEVRSKTMDGPLPSTSANPAEAQSEDQKKAEAAAALKAAEAKKNAASKAAPTAGEIAEQKAAEAKRADAIKKFGSLQDSAQSIPKTSAAAVSDGFPVAQVPQTPRVDPAALEHGADAAKATGGLAVSGAPALVPVSDLMQREFVLMNIESAIRLNYKVMVQRYWLKKLSALRADNREYPMTSKQEAFLSELRANFGLDDSASRADILSRVDGVNVNVLLAITALESNWGTSQKVDTMVLGEKFRAFNSSIDEDKIRFRAMRAALHVSQERLGHTEALELAKVLLATNGTNLTAEQLAVLTTVEKIAVLLQDAEVAALIDKTTMELATADGKSEDPY